MKPITYVLVDHYDNWLQLQPLTINKPICHLRIGIDTIQEKWTAFLQNDVAIKTCAAYLSSYNSWEPKSGHSYVMIRSNVLPNTELIDAIHSIQTGETLYSGTTQVASKITIGEESFEKEIAFKKELLIINRPWDIFQSNDTVLKSDFKRLTASKVSQPIHESNRLIGNPDDLFVEEGAQVWDATLNTSKGPIYIGKNAEVMEGTKIRGPLALLDNAVLKLGAKIYGATTIGPFCKVGGEVNNSVIMGYSNKGHDGFLGNSVIGEWCNLGADTNNSNLKNNYGIVKAYSYLEEDYISSDLQFLGLIMGDHSKCGINTMFNTGTVTGVFANIFGGDFPPKHIPSFSWGGAKGFEKYQIEKAIEVAQRVMERRNKKLSKADEEILIHLHENMKS